MKVAWFGFLCMIWMTGMFLTDIINNEITGDEAAESLTQTTSTTVIETTTDTGSTSLTNAVKNFFGTITSYFTWDFAFFEGGFEWIRWFILTPITTIFAAGFILMFASAIWGYFAPR